ncbi:DUF2735 domain-containing protein [Pararhizobium sp. BT-229]|uniref:DUF2735 domain-containing protein n=1 Tax=Pararhizobium sp. BT-229 TaxID=2986923 RepID=UPI0021F6FABB|nr:DUF2735 domain-containing protein [Pararhizobium sp. BT-229]MCV9962785.1 DUF2735 domain-containing protein [Pararhizobium sp. BT-229]
MAMISTGETAKIFEFPVGGRNLGGRRFDQPGTVAEFRPKPVLVVDYSNWYHEEALRDEQTPKS